MPFCFTESPRPASWSAPPAGTPRRGSGVPAGRPAPPRCRGARPPRRTGEEQVGHPPQPRRGRAVSQQEHAAGLEHPGKLRRRRARVGIVVERVVAQQHLKPPVGKGQALGVPLHQLHRAAQLFPGHRQHIGRQIQPCPGGLRKPEPHLPQQLSRAAAHVQNRAVGESGQAAPATPGTAHGHGCRSGRCHRSMPAGQRLGQSAFYSRSSHILLIEFIH